MFRMGADGRKVDEDGFKTSGHTPSSPWFCVAVRANEAGVQVRDTKDPLKTTLTFSKDEWQAFVAGVKNGEFDV